MSLNVSGRLKMFSDGLNFCVRRERNVSQSEERRALMLPQELKAMSQNEEIIIYEGMAHPAKVSKIRYYRDRMFTARLKNKVEVKALEI